MVILVNYEYQKATVLHTHFLKLLHEFSECGEIEFAPASSRNLLINAL